MLPTLPPGRRKVAHFLPNNVDSFRKFIEQKMLRVTEEYRRGNYKEIPLKLYCSCCGYNGGRLTSQSSTLTQVLLFIIYSLVFHLERKNGPE